MTLSVAVRVAPLKSIAASARLASNCTNTPEVYPALFCVASAVMEIFSDATSLADDNNLTSAFAFAVGSE